MSCRLIAELDGEGQSASDVVLPWDLRLDSLTAETGDLADRDVAVCLASHDEQWVVCRPCVNPWLCVHNGVAWEGAKV